MRRLLSLFPLLLLAPAAHAVVVRGKITSAVGVPLAHVRVQLIQGQRSVASALSLPDGTYEIRTAYSGRFLLLVAPPGANFSPQIGAPFYGGRADLLNLDIALNNAGITPQVSSQLTLTPDPLEELSSPVAQLAADQFLTHVNPSLELADTTNAFILQQGQVGAPATVYLRGAPPQTLLTTVDSVTANPFGGALNLSRLSTTGISAFSPEPALELTPTANPLFLTGASGGVLTVAPARGEALSPVLTYTGDGGNQGAYRNEGVASWAHERFDLLGAFSRFNINNATPAAPFHLTTWAANVGYQISAGTSLRFAGRYDTAASALNTPYSFFLVNPQGRDASQNLFASATFETHTAGKWHNLARFGMLRTRAQTFDYQTPLVGQSVTITGANGFSATGTAAFHPLPSREDNINGRNEATYQTDYSIASYLAIAGEFHFQNENTANILPPGAFAVNKRTLGLNHYAGAVSLQGELHHRFFYQASGFLDHSPIYGITGTPRLGLTYVPVRPGTRKFRGTTLHATAATGTREPSLFELAAVTTNLQLPRSRTFDASVSQNILGQKLVLRGTYFHSQFSHEFEALDYSSVASQPVLSQTLALRAQGAESDLRYQPFHRVLLEAGYTYLAALTEQSAAPALFNPSLPTLAIGGLTALAGQRPFHRPPHSGFFLAEYSGNRLNASFKGAFASKSDSSTELLSTPALLLPNRNLSPGYVSMDANLSMRVSKHFTAFTQLSNLADNRHMAPLGFETTPFLVRAGLRIRIGGE